MNVGEDHVRTASAVIGLVMAIAAGMPAAFAAGEDADAGGQSAWMIDAAFVAALAQGDTGAAAKFARADFVRIGQDGEIASGAAAAGGIPAPKQEETDVGRNLYGRLATVRGAHGPVRFLRVWAQDGGQWRLFAEIETRVVPAARASVEAQAGQGDCENPCRTVPYQPKTAMDKAILQAWQETKRIEWKPDAAAWSHFIADEFMIINNTTIRAKPERMVIAKRQETSGQGTPGDPVLAMDIHDFGDTAAVMISKHFPVRGGKPYNNIRVWVLRDGRWQLAISQQSEIKAAEPLPAAN